MKQIVANMLYNTDNSTVIYTDKGTKRQLYKTQNGAYFMLFNNGEITPITKDMAKEYLGIHSVEDYIKEFGDVEEA